MLVSLNKISYSGLFQHSNFVCLFIHLLVRRFTLLWIGYTCPPNPITFILVVQNLRLIQNKAWRKHRISFQSITGCKIILTMFGNSYTHIWQSPCLTSVWFHLLIVLFYRPISHPVVSTLKLVYKHEEVSMHKCTIYYLLHCEESKRKVNWKTINWRFCPFFGKQSASYYKHFP